MEKENKEADSVEEDSVKEEPKVTEEEVVLVDKSCDIEVTEEEEVVVVEKSCDIVKEPKGWADQVEEEEEELNKSDVQEESKDSPGKEGDTEEEVYRSYVKKTFKKDSLTLQRRLAVKFPQVMLD